MGASFSGHGNSISAVFAFGQFAVINLVSWILGNMTRNARHELPKTLDFTDWLPIST